MCGIAFVYDPDSEGEDRIRRMRDCLRVMYHRGPDDGHMEVAGGAIIGHRRLSIIDLEGSKQPMWDPSGRYLLSYNGEIYNYSDIRNRLASRWSFRTHGDTEVLLAGLLVEGVAILEAMEGMWAFALWDSWESRILIGRDRMGKKPAFYKQLETGGFACASELPALKKLTRDAWHENIDSSADFIRYGYQMPGYTAWDDVYEVLPGHVLSWQAGAGVTQESWWSLDVASFAGDADSAKHQLRTALIAAVESRMVADVEVGAFLSGGIDSSLIAAIVRHELGRPLKTFTIGFSDKNYDERNYAEIVSNALMTEHYEDVLSDWDESELEALMLNHVGQPFGDTSLLPTHLLSRLAASKVKVALSGDGSDELFCGYQRYQARTLLRWYTRLPKSVKKNLNRLVRVIPEPMAHHSRSLIKKAHLFLDIIDKQESEMPYCAPVQFSNNLFGRLAPDLASHGHAPPALPQVTEPGDLKRMMIADSSIYLPQDILAKLDRASMSQSLELRAPFLDSRVVKSALSYPLKWHHGRLRGKLMLKQSFGSMLPESVWNRRKQGFGLPLHEWFRGELGERLRGWLHNDPGPFRRSETLRYLDEHVGRKRDHGFRLWHVYVYLLWRTRGWA